MKKEVELINVNCPVCENPIVTTYKGKDVKGQLLHKCGRCKRYWDVNYTNKRVRWVKGKEHSTTIKEYRMDLKTGNCYTLYAKNLIKLY